MGRAIAEKPVMIIAHTIPGKGVDFMEYDFHWHGMPPNHEQAKLALHELRTLQGRIRASMNKLHIRNSSISLTSWRSAVRFNAPLVILAPVAAWTAFIEIGDQLTSDGYNPAFSATLTVLLRIVPVIIVSASLFGLATLGRNRSSHIVTRLSCLFGLTGSVYLAVLIGINLW